MKDQEKKGKGTDPGVLAIQIVTGKNTSFQILEEKISMDLSRTIKRNIVQVRSQKKVLTKEENPDILPDTLDHQCIRELSIQTGISAILIRNSNAIYIIRFLILIVK